MTDSTQGQPRFPPIASMTARVDFESGALSSDFGAVLLHGVDRHIRLSARLAAESPIKLKAALRSTGFAPDH